MDPTGLLGTAAGGGGDTLGPMGAACIEVRGEGLVKSFGDHRVLNDVPIEVRSGEIVAIVGGSGSGKTVLLDILTGLVQADGGRVLVADHDKPGAPLVDIATLDEEGLSRIRLHWSVVFQRNALFTGTVFDNVALWFREHTEMSEAEIEGRVRESLTAAQLDVDDVIRKSRDELSGGMAKRAAIARSIAVDPRVIFYDEPTTGLDPVVAGRIHELIWDVHHRPRADGSARTSVVVTHDRELLRRLAPRVFMLHESGVCFDGSYEEFGKPGTCPPAEEYLAAMPVLNARVDS